jgi:ABC-type microcin C transport system permease subunit YejB
MDPLVIKFMDELIENGKQYGLPEVEEFPSHSFFENSHYILERSEADKRKTIPANCLQNYSNAFAFLLSNTKRLTPSFKVYKVKRYLPYYSGDKDFKKDFESVMDVIRRESKLRTFDNYQEQISAIGVWFGMISYIASIPKEFSKAISTVQAIAAKFDSPWRIDCSATNFMIDNNCEIIINDPFARPI